MENTHTHIHTYAHTYTCIDTYTHAYTHAHRLMDVKNMKTQNIFSMFFKVKQ